eukprot:13871607-Alexandrium_andersonii.AAC.1
MEAVAVRAHYPMGLGAVRKRPASIPQGCLLSMMVQALMTVPWVRLLKAKYDAVVPRCLADDLLLSTRESAEGPGPMDEEHVADQHAEAVVDTIEYITAMGGRISVA